MTNAGPSDIENRATGTGRGRRRFLAQTLWMIAALSAASVLNVVFVALLARTLEPRDLGAFFCSWSILLLAAAPGGAVQTYLAGLFASRPGEERTLVRRWSGILGLSGAAAAALFAALSPVLAPLLRYPSELPVIATGLAVSAYAPLPLLYGRLQGVQSFGRLGAAYLVEAGTRPLAAWALARAALLDATTSVAAMASGYLVSFLAAFPLGLAFARRSGLPSEATPPESEPKRPGSGEPPRGGPGGPAISFPSTAVSLLTLSAFAYLDVLFDRHFLGDRSGGPGSLLGGSGDYGAAAYLGRAFVMVALPLVTVMVPRVAAATKRGESPLSFLRDAVLMALFPWALGGAACVFFAEDVTGALFPSCPGAASLVRLFPAAILPYVLLAVFTPFNLARGRTGTAWILLAGVAFQWAGYLAFHGSHRQILAVLGLSGAAAALAVMAYTWAAERRRGGGGNVRSWDVGT
jgi:O-antigen/teichoic acid export membrane protein